MLELLNENGRLDIIIFDFKMLQVKYLIVY